jgi:hypothetical protein
MGLNISAAPSTGALLVRNINLTREPCPRRFDKQSKPPVREMTCNLPGVQRPSSNRRTAGVVSASHARAAAPIGERWGEVCHVLSRISYSAGEEREVRKDQSPRNNRCPSLRPRTLRSWNLVRWYE